MLNRREISILLQSRKNIEMRAKYEVFVLAYTTNQSAAMSESEKVDQLTMLIMNILRYMSLSETI
jgi:hypothetical protein